MKKKFFGILTCAVMASALILPACATNGEGGDPNDKIELKTFNMLIDDGTNKNDGYPFGIQAPKDWTQVGYNLSYSDNEDIYSYFRNEGVGEFRSLPFELYTPYLSLSGNDGEYAYGYLDIENGNLAQNTPLTDYLNLFLSANDYEMPETVMEITMTPTPFTHSGDTVTGLSFDKQINLNLTERIVIFKTNKYQFNSEDNAIFGVFHMGCDSEDFDTKKTLFDRMEKTIFGEQIKKMPRYTDAYLGNAQNKANYSALGLKIELPNDYLPFSQSSLSYSSTSGKMYTVWASTEKYTLDDAGTVSIQISREPVDNGDVFAPETNLFNLHSDAVHGLCVAPPKLTALTDGTVAVYSSHNSYKGFIKSSNEEMRVKEAKREIVYTFIKNECVYKVDFTLTYCYALDYGEESGTKNSTVFNAVNALNKYEEFLVYNAMNNISFD